MRLCPRHCIVLFALAALCAAGFTEETLLLQTWLDRQNFSCGSIDGVWGGKTEDALKAWQRINGLPARGTVTDAIREELNPEWLFTSYTVTTNDHAALVVIPNERPLKANLPYMGYESIQEGVAERFHMSPKGLARLNSAVTNWPNPKAGTVLRVPDTADVAVHEAETISISLSKFQLRALNKEGATVALFPVSIARDHSKAPTGHVSIVTIAPNPNYRYDPALYGDSPAIGKKIFQPGPNNPVGSVWFGLSLSGYGIHGSPHPETVGRPESKGCFRLSNWNALKLLKMVDHGTPVQIEE